MDLTIRTFEDLLFIVDTNAEWRKKLVKALFPEIDVPKALQELAEAQRRTEKAVRETQEALLRLEAIVAENSRQLVRLDMRIERLEEKVETGFAEAAADRQAIKERLDGIDQRLDGMDQRFDGIDQRFDGIDQRFDGIDQRFDGIDQRLDGMDQRFDGIDQRFDGIDQRFDGIDQRFDGIDQRLDGMDQRFDGIDQRLDGMDQRFDAIDQRLDGMDQRFDGIDNTLKQLKGDSYEGKIRDRAAGIFGRYVKRGRDVTNEIGEKLDEAEDNGLISESEGERVLAADLLWGGTLKATKENVVLVVELSWWAEQNDVNRAVNRAAILRRIGVTALPVVGGNNGWVDGLPEIALQKGVVIMTGMQFDKASWKAAIDAIS